MGVELRLPNITGSTEKEQLAQLKSYLYQLTEQLQWALNTVSAPATTQQVVVQTAINAPSSSSQPFDTEVTFAALKPLIIKSADIVEAYYEEINRKLEGIYVAESDFGIFKEQTSQSISETSTGIERAFTDIQSINGDVGDLDSKYATEVGNLDTKLAGAVEGIEGNIQALGGDIDDLDTKITDAEESISEGINGLKGEIDNLNSSIVEVNAHIKTGLLYYDENEIPIYGLEVGKRTYIDGVEVFNKYARFTSSRLSFYDQNNNEVAYISDKKLYIANFEVVSSYKIGGLIDTVLSNGDVVTKWVGIGGVG